jgi:hypothetical protein
MTMMLPCGAWKRSSQTDNAKPLYIKLLLLISLVVEGFTLNPLTRGFQSSCFLSPKLGQEHFPVEWLGAV